ncbi:MAG: hypothetical protein ACFFF4_17205 [Candidatus Thorarchaeota archaeon]
MKGIIVILVILVAIIILYIAFPFAQGLISLIMFATITILIIVYACFRMIKNDVEDMTSP